MPGVLMLQTLVEAGAWLLRVTEDFRYSVIVLREAKNVKYGHFMEPGRQMRIGVELTELGDQVATLKGKGDVDGQATVTARLSLGRYNLRDRNPAWQATDDRIVAAQACAEQVEKEWGRLDILVNNAGMIKDDLFIRMDPEAWAQVLQTNLGGTYNFCRAVAYTMMKQRRGRIINISSVAAEHVNQGQANYAASKGAINALTRALAVELASRNVTVNAIAPGFTETEMTEALRNKAGEVIKKIIPMRRLGQPEDVARVALFLASEDAAYVTGQV